MNIINNQILINYKELIGLFLILAAFYLAGIFMGYFGAKNKYSRPGNLALLKKGDGEEGYI